MIRPSERLCAYVSESEGSAYGAGLGSIARLRWLPFLARSYNSTALRAERSDVSDASNSTCFSQQTPMLTGNAVCTLRCL